MIFTAVATSAWAVLGKKLFSAMTLGRRLDIHCTVWQDIFACCNINNKISQSLLSACEGKDVTATRKKLVQA